MLSEIVKGTLSFPLEQKLLGSTSPSVHFEMMIRCPLGKWIPDGGRSIIKDLQAWSVKFEFSDQVRGTLEGSPELIFVFIVQLIIAEIMQARDDAAVVSIRCWQSEQGQQFYYDFFSITSQLGFK